MRRPDDAKLYHDDTDYVTMVVSMLQKGAGKEKGFVALQNIKVVTEADLTSIDSNKKHSFQVRLCQEASVERLHWQNCFHLLRLGFGVIGACRVCSLGL